MRRSRSAFLVCSVVLAALLAAATRADTTLSWWTSFGVPGNDEYREVLIRSYLEQESRESICADLALTPRELTQRLFRAKRSLKRELSKAERRRGLTVVN